MTKSLLPLCALLLGGCQAKHPPAHHVLIAYPEHWNDGDRKPCFLGPAGGSTVNPALIDGNALTRAFTPPPDLPQLDCDRFVQGELIHKTPPERIFALDVLFDGDYSPALSGKAGNETTWTCQRIRDAITCKP